MIVNPEAKRKATEAIRLLEQAVLEVMYQAGPGVSFPATEIARQIGIDPNEAPFPAYRKNNLATYIIGRLSEAGKVRRDGTDWRITTEAFDELRAQ